MKTIYALFFLCAFTNSQAQSIDKSVISNSGNVNSNATNSIIFTVGETLIGPIANSQSIEQGFWYSVINHNTLSTDITAMKNTMQIYPNPTSGFFTIKTSDLSSYSLSLFDVRGQKIMTKRVNNVSQENNIDISALSKGIYMLLLTNSETKESKTLEIIKN